MVLRKIEGVGTARDSEDEYPPESEDTEIMSDDGGPSRASSMPDMVGGREELAEQLANRKRGRPVMSGEYAQKGVSRL